MPPNEPDARRARIRYLVIAGLLPCLVVAWANAVYTYNHFYATGAFIHDSGWFSSIVFRQGVFPSNPPSAEGLPHYFNLHVSFVVVLGSLLSYAFPGDRVDWYCLFQGAIYAPLGAAAALLLPKTARPTGVAAIAGVGAAGVAFAFNGQAFSCMGFPHYEILIPAGISVMLAGLATARPRIAWTGLALAVATREDGGAHAATFLVAVLACDLLGRPFPVTRKRLVAMTVFAAAFTFALMLVQKRFFHASSLFHHEYLGEPAYAHVTAALVRKRIFGMLEHSLFVVLPLAATGVIAIVDRDARWLLGWAVALPWLALNFFAAQGLKATFDVYTGFPFIGSIFWVGAYASVKYSGRTGLRLLLGRLAIVSVMSSIGVIVSWPWTTRSIALAMLAPRDVDRPAIRTYARALRASPSAYGRLLVDPAMASWATESLSADAVVHGPTSRDHDDLHRYDAITFFRTTGRLGPGVHNTLANGGFDHCGELPRTAIVFCNRGDNPLPPGFTSAPFLKQSLFFTEYVTRTADGDLSVVSTPRQELGAYGPFTPLVPGRYRARFGIRMGECPSVPKPHAAVEVFAKDHMIVAGMLEESAGSVALDFEVPPPSILEGVELRTFTGACPYTLESVELTAL